jgi:hypothetical protein
MRLVSRTLGIDSCLALTLGLTLEPPEPPANPLCTILPFGRDPNHVQRSVLLEEVRKMLSHSRRAALVGMVGVGYVSDVRSSAQPIS